MGDLHFIGFNKHFNKKFFNIPGATTFGLDFQISILETDLIIMSLMNWKVPACVKCHVKYLSSIQIHQTRGIFYQPQLLTVLLFSSSNLKSWYYLGLGTQIWLVTPGIIRRLTMRYHLSERVELLIKVT